jgi:hypothetical protein
MLLDEVDIAGFEAAAAATPAEGAPSLMSALSALLLPMLMQVLLQALLLLRA